MISHKFHISPLEVHNYAYQQKLSFSFIQYNMPSMFAITIMYQQTVLHVVKSVIVGVEQMSRLMHVNKASCSLFLMSCTVRMALLSCLWATSNGARIITVK